MMINLKGETCWTYPVESAIAVIALQVEEKYSAGAPYNAVQVVEIIESFCEVAPSPRWTAISAGVVERLERWGIIDNEGEIL